MLIPISYLPLMTHFASMHFELTIKPQFGNGLQRCPLIPSPFGCGWCTEDGRLAIDWMDGLPAPKAVLELLSCQCSRSCKLPSCSCMANGLKCTDLRRLQDCTNRCDDDDVVPDDEDDDDDENYDDDENCR